MTIDELNEKFALDDTLTFTAGENDRPCLRIDNDHATAEIYVPGAHVTAYRPHGQRPVLWVSRQAEFRSGKAIRGGVPVIWPWFADHPTDRTLPSHGLVRQSDQWRVTATEQLADGGTAVELAITDEALDKGAWPYRCGLTLRVTVGERLRLDLTTHNRDERPFEITAALHTYFAVGHAARIEVRGLDGREYVDKTDAHRPKWQKGPVKLEGEVDRIFLATPDECTIVDPLWRRRIHIAKENSFSTVVWNPGPEVAARMADFGDTEYGGMVCVETANAAADSRTVAPGEQHTLTAEIRLVKGIGEEEDG